MAALLDLRMPGVYTQEISTLPPTVGVIPSAVPVFVGYTEFATKKGDSLLGKPTRIRSLKEYTDLFGSAPLQNIQVNIDDRITNSNKPEVTVLEPADFKFKLYHELAFYYANGGGPAYILSVGDYNGGDPDHQVLIDAIQALVKVQDITILVFPDGTSLTESNYAAVIQAALLHCQKMKDRVTVIDLHNVNGEDLDAIENGFQTNMPNDIEVKKYGMAYYPYIETVFSYGYAETGVTVKNHLQTPPTDAATVTALATKSTTLSNASKDYVNALNDANDKAAELADLQFLQSSLQDYKDANLTANDAALKTQLLLIAKNAGIEIPNDVNNELNEANPVPLTILSSAITTAQTSATAANTTLTSKQTALTAAATDAKAGVKFGTTRYDVSLVGVDMATISVVNNMVYGKIKDAIANYPVTLPPCGAIAGIYVRTDAASGVWKAPANVSVFGAIQPEIDIDDDLHANLNAPASGKAINVIRTYPGRGLLVYGARTLAGNDLEWRYVNVRRTFCFIEDSIANAMQDFVFEPNNEQTWIKVKAMIRSFLNKIWKAGGLFGATPDDAYDVVCSVPESMNEDDVLNGIMRIYVKVAVARPAEFIVLQYEHKFDPSEA
jgi:uncharacterized protein